MATNDLSLAGKVALITGSGKENGVGAGIAKALARAGASVAIHHVSETSKASAERLAKDIAQETGSKTTVVRGAVNLPETAPRLVQETLAAFNVDHIDILVNNAAVISRTPLLEVKEEQLLEEYTVNVFGPIYLTQAAVKEGKMPPGGRIINIGSIASKMGMSIGASYSASKAAMDSLTMSWASDLGHSHGITINTVAPGHVVTDLSKDLLEGDDAPPTHTLQAIYSQTRAAPRIGTAEDIGDVVLLIASEKSRWLTAQWISASGGLTGVM
ncbi:NAD(P)-binding protein [Xylariaceae sp. FL0255]|nr:NAD(P)-binding protein [Xylariaceae sp. FL0255]